MSPVSKSESGGDGGVSNKNVHRQSKSHDKQSSIESPSSKQSYGSSRTSGGGSKGHHRRRRSSPSMIKSSLRETLSSFGDDVIRIKKHPGQYAYDNHGYFQSDFSFDSSASANGVFKKDEESSFPNEKESGESELAVIMSHHDPCFQTKHFERVKPSEVGMKPSKWQQLFQASVSASRLQKLKRQNGRGDGELWSSENNFLENFYNSNGLIEQGPPFWGVSRRTRGNFSFLSLSLILHELACFTSAVLLGCMIFQGMEAVSWVQQKPFTENWLLFKCSSSFQTVLVVITCIGFLNRVDTTDVRSLWMLPLFLVPVLGLSISDYCNKSWELQRLECFNYFRLEEKAQGKVHLSQDCSPLIEAFVASTNFGNNNKEPSKNPNIDKIIASSLTSLTELNSRGVGPLVMHILAMLSILFISVYLFCCRKYNFLIDLFGPPQEFGGNLELVLLNNENGSRKTQSPENDGGGDNGKDGVKVIFKRNSSSWN